MKTIHHGDIAGNVAAGLIKLEATELGKMAFGDLLVLHQCYPMTLFPAFGLQKCIAQAVIGPQFWEHKRSFLSDLREEEKSLKAEHANNNNNKKDGESKKVDNDNNTLATTESIKMSAEVKENMGIIKYYLLPHLRHKAQARIRKMHAIERQVKKSRKVIPT